MAVAELVLDVKEQGANVIDDLNKDINTFGDSATKRFEGVGKISKRLSDTINATARPAFRNLQGTLSNISASGKESLSQLQKQTKKNVIYFKALESVIPKTAKGMEKLTLDAKPLRRVMRGVSTASETASASLKEAGTASDTLNSNFEILYQTSTLTFNEIDRLFQKLRETGYQQSRYGW